MPYKELEVATKVNKDFLQRDLDAHLIKINTALYDNPTLKLLETTAPFNDTVVSILKEAPNDTMIVGTAFSHSAGSSYLTRLTVDDQMRLTDWYRADSGSSGLSYGDNGNADCLIDIRLEISKSSKDAGDAPHLTFQGHSYTEGDATQTEQWTDGTTVCWFQNIVWSNGYNKPMIFDLRHNGASYLVSLDGFYKITVYRQIPNDPNVIGKVWSASCNIERKLNLKPDYQWIKQQWYQDNNIERFYSYGKNVDVHKRLTLTVVQHNDIVPGNAYFMVLFNTTTYNAGTCAPENIKQLSGNRTSYTWRDCPVFDANVVPYILTFYYNDGDPSMNFDGVWYLQFTIQ